MSDANKVKNGATVPFTIICSGREDVTLEPGQVVRYANVEDDGTYYIGTQEFPFETDMDYLVTGNALDNLKMKAFSEAGDGGFPDPSTYDR